MKCGVIWPLRDDEYLPLDEPFHGITAGVCDLEAEHEGDHSSTYAGRTSTRPQS